MCHIICFFLFFFYQLQFCVVVDYRGVLSQVEMHFPDGVKEIIFPDATRKIINPDGLQVRL